MSNYEIEINKIIVFGSNGMLGNYIKSYFFEKGYNVIGINRNNYDVMKHNLNDLNDLNDLENLLLEHNINENTLIFNGIGTIPQASKNYEINNEMYYKINALFPKQLNEIRKKYKAYMIHPTTDCVYSGKRGNYTELDLPDAIDVYGQTKLMGEQMDCTIIRTSIIGEEINNKRSLVEWVKSNKNKEINGYINHYWNGITCLQFAKIVEQMIKENIFWNGVKHIFSPNTVSKYELVKLINDKYKLNIKINEFNTAESKNMTIKTVYNINKLFDIPNISDQVNEMNEFFLLN